MPRQKHPKKEIEAAISHAEQKGWTISKGNGHAWGKMYCPGNSDECRCGEHCITSIFSTPKSSANHARKLKSVVDKCIKV